LNDSLTFDRSIEGGSSRHALLVLDIQETFTFSPRRDSQSPEACDRLIESINGLSQVAFRSDIMVLYAHQERANPLARSPSRFVVKKVDGNRRSPEHLRLVPGYSFIKPGKDAFSNVELDDFLRKNRITHLFLVGSDGVTSIKQTARSALDLGYRVTFIQDGIFTAFESKWERVLNSFESEAAFAIASEEFAEFAVAVRQASEARRRSHERDLAIRLVTPVTR
jgi:nicotinamidase-related amidase